MASAINMSIVKKMLKPSTPKALAMEEDAPSRSTSYHKPIDTKYAVIAALNVVTVAKVVEERRGARELNN